MKKFNRYLLITFIAMCFFYACGPKLAEVELAINDANAEYEKFKAENPSQQATLMYRNVMSNAEKAKEEKKYKLAFEEANKAKALAQEGLKNRLEFKKDLEKRLEILKKQIEKTPYPTKRSVNAYFDAMDAYQNRDYDLASKNEQIGKAALKQMQVIGQANNIPVQGRRGYFNAGGRIQIYESISDDGTPSKVLFNLKDPVIATFLGSKLISRDKRYIKVRIRLNKTIEGWVDAKWTK